MATATWSFYMTGVKKCLDGTIDLDSNTIKVALTTSGYTPSMGVHDFFDDVTNEVTGTGYTAGGAALASKTLTATLANSWATTWAASTAYVVGDIVRPTSGNTFLYQCEVAGTSAGSQPTWPTVRGTTVADNTVTWNCAGTFIVVWDADDPSWTSSTISSVAYAVVYKDTGTASTSPLIGLLTLSATVSSSSGTLSIPLHATLGICYFLGA